MVWSELAAGTKVAIAIIDDLVVSEGTVVTYVQNNNLALAAALLMGGDVPNEYEPSLINRGEMHLDNPNGFDGTLIYFSSHLFWDNALIQNYGLISAIDDNNVAAIFAPSWGPDLYNAGTIFAKASRSATAIATWDLTSHYTNAAGGRISAESAGTAIAVRMANGHGFIIDLEFWPYGSLTNHGDIIARSTGVSQPNLYAGAVAVHLGTGGPGDYISVVNTGLIEATDADPEPGHSSAILVNGDAGGTIINSGTIRADYAIHEVTDNQWNTYNLTIENSGLIEGRFKINEGNDRVLNSGTIIGNVELGMNADTLVNSGTITGEVALGAGNDIYDGTGGVQNGRVLGQDGADLLIGTAGGEILDGGAGDDILVGAGGDTLTGGTGRDRFVFSELSSGGTPTITDFATGVDMIDLRSLQPTSVTINGSTVTAVTSAGSLVIQVTGAISQSDILTVDASSLVGSSVADALIAGLAATSFQGLGGDDLMIGGSFNDVLDGGAGEDMMWGGLGDDLYVVDVGIDSTTSGDVVVELAGAGTDHVQTFVDFLLPANVENLTLVGLDPIDGLGNDLANIIIGNAGANFMKGNGGADLVIAGDGNDYLAGGSGLDILTGGSGNDNFQDSTAGLNGDIITDFGVGDGIIFLNASLATFEYSISGSTLTYSGGSLTLQGGAPGSLVASMDASGGVRLSIHQALGDAQDDFNGDGHSDILWRSDSGHFSNWLGLVGGGFVGNDANAFATVPTSWQIAGAGDFNGDGRDDVLWRNDAGELSNWLGQTNGGFVNNDANALTSAPTNWHVAGVGDFNGDWRDDILWRNDAGQLSDWLGTASGGFANNDANAFANVPTNWHVVAIGNFNGDGRDDILWRNDAGQLSNWLGTASGGFTNNDANAFSNVPTNWHVAGTGDFNGDGRDDILWRSDTGQLSNWLATANGGFVNNDANAFTTVPTNWQVVAIGDYDGDGREDILWRSDTGALSNWLGQANGGFALNDAIAFNQVSTDWLVQPLDYL